MRYDYKICPHCGASLDIGEACDCENEETERREEPTEAPKMTNKGQFIIDISKYVYA